MDTTYIANQKLDQFSWTNQMIFSHKMVSNDVYKIRLRLPLTDSFEKKIVCE